MKLIYLIIIIIGIIATSGTVSARIIYDNIKTDNNSIYPLYHQILLCPPQPTDNIQSGLVCRPGTEFPRDTDTYNIAEYPLDDLPSGGSSIRVSPSEMVLTTVALQDYPWINDNITITYYNTENIPFFTNNCGISSVCKSFIGHFSWEINKPGQYYIEITTSRGNALIGYNVIDSFSSVVTPTPMTTETPTPMVTETPTPMVTKIKPTQTQTPEITKTQTSTVSPTITSTVTPTITPIPAITVTPIETPTPTVTETPSSSIVNTEQTRNTVETLGTDIGYFVKWLGKGIINGLMNG